ncbi:MAG: heat-inducible transcriptional repressor HrcA, partial [Stellaceae bacterium]
MWLRMPRPLVASPINELNERSREIFRLIVDSYVATGEPIGSRTLSRRLGQNLSPATIRNVMADLEEAGLLYAPHTSAGRLPTELGLRLFVHGLLEIGGLAEDERRSIESLCVARGKSLPQALEEATSALSGLSHCAGIVVVPNQDRPLKHIEFVNLGPGRALVVLVTEDGLVENRVIEVPAGLPPAALISAGNYLNARLIGRTVEEAKAEIEQEIASNKIQLDELTS